MKQDEAQAIADMTAKFLGLPNRPRVEYQREGKVALAWLQENRITLPLSFIADGYIWHLWAIIHEVCHFADGCGNHRNKFKETEKKALAFWGVRIVKYRSNKKERFYPAKLAYI